MSRTNTTERIPIYGKPFAWLAVDMGRLLYMRCRCLCRYGRVMCLARTSAFGAGVGVHQASAANGAARLRA